MTMIVAHETRLAMCSSWKKIMLFFFGGDIVNTLCNTKHNWLILESSSMKGIFHYLKTISITIERFTYIQRENALPRHKI
ncbi:hypothetical protein FKM82_025630 [Ascaphus truei]